VVAGVGGPAELFCFYLLQSAGAVVYCRLNLERIEMTDQEKIDLLGEALNNLMQSADAYIVDGTWIDELTHDIKLARAVIKQVSTTERIEKND
jgi:hypothetical protein